MKKMLKATWIFFVEAGLVCLTLLSASQLVFPATAALALVTKPGSFISSERADPHSIVEMVNPASAHCTQVGGTVIIQTRGDGGEYGLCQFEDNRACEEWALLRGQCPIGGVKTTGYDTIAQQYCAWLGGKTFAVPQANCTLPDGNVCNDNALYAGKMCYNKARSKK